MKSNFFPILFCLALLALVVYLFWPKPEPERTVNVWKQANQMEAHTRGSDFDKPLPANLPEEKIGRHVRVTVRDTVQPEDTAGTVKTFEIDIVVPVNPDEPVLVRADTVPGGSVIVEETQFVDSWFQVKLHLLAGVSADWKRGVSPAGQVSLVTLWNTLYVGPAADRYGVGVGVSIELWREWNVMGKKNLAQFDDTAQDWQAGILYRF